MDNYSTEDGFRAFRNVVQSLMKDASRVTTEVDPAAGQAELRERLDLVGHYIRYTLRYCTECPLIKPEPRDIGHMPFKTMESPGLS